MTGVTSIREMNLHREEVFFRAIDDDGMPSPMQGIEDHRVKKREVSALARLEAAIVDHFFCFFFFFFFFFFCFFFCFFFFKKKKRNEEREWIEEIRRFAR